MNMLVGFLLGISVGAFCCYVWQQRRPRVERSTETPPSESGYGDRKKVADVRRLLMELSDEDSTDLEVPDDILKSQELDYFLCDWRQARDNRTKMRIAGVIADRLDGLEESLEQRELENAADDFQKLKKLLNEQLQSPVS